MTSEIKPFNRDAKLTVEVQPDGVSFRDWMDEVPYAPPPIEPMSAERIELFNKLRHVLSETVRLHEAGDIPTHAYNGERRLASACHQLKDFDLAKLSWEQALEMSAAETEHSRKKSLFDLAIGLEERTKYSYRAF